MVSDCKRLISMMHKFADVLPSLLAAPFIKLLSLWKEATFIGSLELLSPCSRLPVLEDFARQVIGMSSDSGGVLLIKHVYEQTIPFLHEVLERFQSRESALQEQIETLQAEIDSFGLDEINAEWERKVSEQLKLAQAAEQRERDTLEKVGLSHPS